MVNKVLIFFLIVSCGNHKKPEVAIDYDYNYVFVENEMFYIERIKIFNSIGQTLYDLKLNADDIGLSKVFLFQSNKQYSVKGSLENIKSDSLEKHIQVEIHSRDKKKIEMFEDRYMAGSEGKKTIDPIKNPFP